MIDLNKFTKHKKFKKYLVICAVSALALSFASCQFFKSDAPSYMTVTAKNRDISKKVFATGTIAGVTQVDVGAQVSGQILKLYVNTGDDVKKGQLLCEIDPKIQETALKTAKAQVEIIDAQISSKQAELKKLRLEYDRQKRLVKLDATSKQDMEVSEASYQMALASLKELNAQRAKAQLSVDDAITNLGYTKILAPMDGTVYATVVTEGQTVNANQTTPTILRLATLDKMKVKTEISEADVVNVVPGMECSFTVLGLPFRVFKGKLDRIDPAPSSYESASQSSSNSSSQSGSSTAVYYNSDIIAENKDRILRIDMTADVTIEIANAKNVLSLPLSAMRKIHDKTGTVFVLLDGCVKEKEVQIGLRDDQFIQIVSGLSADEQVVIGDDVKSAEAKAQENSRNRRGPF